MKVLQTKEKQKELREKLGIKNVMATPRVEKIVVSMAVVDALKDKKNIDRSSEVLTQIAGQKAKITKAKKSIATFKLREGDPIGVMVTLRGDRMHNFLEKLINVSLPRVRDFRGVSRKGFDKKGNYNLGFSEFIVFPEIDPGKIDRVQGLQVTIVTSAKTDHDAMALLESLGMPFMKG